MLSHKSVEDACHANKQVYRLLAITTNVIFELLYIGQALLQRQLSILREIHNLKHKLKSFHQNGFNIIIVGVLISTCNSPAL